MTTNNQVVISRIQHRRGLKENLPQPLRPGELALATDLGELWIGGDPNQPPYGIRTYGTGAEITQAEDVVDTKIAFALFSSPLTQTQFDALVLYLTTGPTPAVVLTDLDILWDEASTVFITADITVDGLNTISNILLAVQNSAVGTYENGSALGYLNYGGTPVDTILSQDETDFDGVGTNGTWTPGGGGGATPYAPGNTITLSDGTIVTVGTVTAGAVDTFTITTATTAPDILTTLVQSSTSGSGAGFELILGTANYTESVVASFIPNTDGQGVFQFYSGNALQGGNAAQLINRSYSTPYNGLVVTLSNIQIPTTGATVGSPTFRDMTVTDTDSGFTWAASGTATADSTADELTFVSGTGINIDVDSTSDAIRITSTSTSTFAGLSDTNLTGQATGDLVFNSDGTNWIDTAGLLTWNGTDTLTVSSIITGTAAAGTLVVDAGPLPAGATNGSTLSVSGGTSTTGSGGLVDVFGGLSTDGNGGRIWVYGGDSTNASGGNAGVYGGNGSNSVGTGGDAELAAGWADVGGGVYIGAGTSVTGAGGSTIIEAGATDPDPGIGDAGGDVYIDAGAGGNFGGGGVYLTGGRAHGGVATQFGVYIDGGDCTLDYGATSCDGAPVNIVGGIARGVSEDAGLAGMVEIRGGENIGGTYGGSVFLIGGDATTPGRVHVQSSIDADIAIFGDTATGNSVIIYDDLANAGSGYALMELYGNNTATGDYLRISAATSPTISAVGPGTNVDIVLLSKGTGVVSVTGTTTYEANITDDDDIPNKKYVDDAIKSPTTTGNALLTAYTLTASTAAFTDVTGFNFDIDAGADVIFVDYSLNIGGAVGGSNNYTAIGTLKIIANTLVNSGEATLVDDQTELRDTGLTGAVAFQASFVGGSPNRVQVQYTNTFTTNATLRVSTKQWMSY